MSDLRHTVTDQVRSQLVAAERSNNKSIAESARLLAVMMDGANRLHAAVEVGHEAVEEAFAGLAASVEGRRRYVAAHQKLLQVAEQIGVDVVATGGAGNKRLSEFFTTGSSTVVEIGQAAA